jgi:hypothetical protein
VILSGKFIPRRMLAPGLGETRKACCRNLTGWGEHLDSSPQIEINGSWAALDRLDGLCDGVSPLIRSTVLPIVFGE